jgi:hypothetical protein
LELEYTVAVVKALKVEDLEFSTVELLGVEASRSTGLIAIFGNLNVF